jgi:hypothetical protein
MSVERRTATMSQFPTQSDLCCDPLKLRRGRMCVKPSPSTSVASHPKDCLSTCVCGPIHRVNVVKISVRTIVIVDSGRYKSGHYCSAAVLCAEHYTEDVGWCSFCAAVHPLSQNSCQPLADRPDIDKDFPPSVGALVF